MVNFHTRLEADAEVAIVHTVHILVGQKEAQMASYGKEEVVVERRQSRKLVLHDLRRRRGLSGTLFLNAGLRLFW